MINIQENILLAPLTSFRVGGNAKFYVEIKSLDELKEAIEYAKENKLDFYVLGGGTNLLVSDKGFDGLVIRIKMNELKVDGACLEIQAGVPLIKAINTAASAGLSGLEYLAGIPGTVGGAVRGNAGAYSCEICSAVKNVTAYDCETNKEVVIEGGLCDFSYRSSVFKKNKNLIVISTILELAPAKMEDIQEKTKETIVKRASMGLHGVKSAGSFFMNPTVADDKLKEEFSKEKGVAVRNDKLPAGWVIDQVGLRGKKIGGAAVSQLHANYIVNDNGATADEIIMLVSYVKQQVRDQLGIQLQEEINYVGF
ncbi:MAG: UDP-N-acetylenolpyruvoylglucosamine reductase [uncultured bacterium]|nr:MAG: UDP-N-acetylenolpyruvoylglucosamine reductase [uncultured bacterium]KKQ61869.1 MAG: UDP-N-acetylenolpyruvoylglucosamine reductase [Parcubacteria group bacterium GW2011_GWC1_38_22]